MSDSGTKPIGLGIVGMGKIAHDQHLPTVAASPDFRLAGAADPNVRLDGVANFPTLEEMLTGAPDVEAVALCTPPRVRHRLARIALEAGKHVLLEKPPGATLSEVEDLKALAEARGLTLFAAWHSRFAACVEPARRWLAGKHIRSALIEWKEDVTSWHPGQKWIWHPGGFGVFDPGINALSVFTRIMPHAVFLTASELFFPANRGAPIAADLAVSDGLGSDMRAVFDWRQKGPQTWNITIACEEGRLFLSRGGAEMAIDGVSAAADAVSEYTGVYARFVELIRDGEADVDLAPLRHVADAFMLGERKEVAPFEE